MFANAKKILITTESREVFIVRRAGGGLTGNCAVCGREVEWLSFDAAISDSTLGWRELVTRSEKGDLHTFQTPTGHLFVCSYSLSALAGEDEEPGTKAGPGEIT